MTAGSLAGELTLLRRTLTLLVRRRLAQSGLDERDAESLLRIEPDRVNWLAFLVLTTDSEIAHLLTTDSTEHGQQRTTGDAQFPSGAREICELNADDRNEPYVEADVASLRPGVDEGDDADTPGATRPLEPVAAEKSWLVTYRVGYSDGSAPLR